MYRLERSLYLFFCIPNSVHVPLLLRVPQLSRNGHRLQHVGKLWNVSPLIVIMPVFLSCEDFRPQMSKICPSYVQVMSKLSASVSPVRKEHLVVKIGELLAELLGTL